MAAARVCLSALRYPTTWCARPSLLRKSGVGSTAMIKRQYSDASSELLQVEKDPNNEAVAILRLNRKPVNGLNKPLLTDLSITLEKLQNDKTCRGLILTSAVPNIFSAGLDITEMYQKTPEENDSFWSTLQDVFIGLYGSNLVTIAAISGHSPAGGCLLAMSCDYRIMSAGKYTIGLNETLLGIIAPFWFIETMKNTIGHRETEKALQLGKLYTPDEALSVGLVDQVCNPEDVMTNAHKEMNKWLKIPDHARILTKQSMRSPVLDSLISKRKEDVHGFTSFIQKDSIQQSLGMYLESLKKRKSK